MTDRPIIFSAPMIRAILNGRKTQTRRILKPQPESVGDKFDAVFRYRVRDRLWVKEAFIGAAGYDGLPPSKFGNKPVWFCADGEPPKYDGNVWWFLSEKRRSPIHMPRWASRLTLIVTDVRVQRVQEISAEDCAKEGVEISDGALVRDGYMVANRKAFRNLWNSIHGPDAWGADPWVCALTFTVRKGNIDDEKPE